MEEGQPSFEVRFQDLSDGFYVSKFTGGQPDYFLVVRQQKPRIGRG